MPFLCINITDFSHSCSKLLKYCDNNYELEQNWCKCITNNYHKCDNSINILFLLPVIIIGGGD
jgi:hypothetical protein